MTPLPNLTELSSEAKDALIAELWKKVQALEAQLEAQSKVLKKTAKNSSLPPSQGFKPNVKPMQTAGVTRQASVGRAGGGRELHPHPDQTIVARLKRCPDCGAEILDSQQQLHGRYDKIELPPIQLIVTRIEQYSGQCESCNRSFVAPVPVGMEPGSPFGASVESLATYLRYTHAISYQRLSEIMAEVFGLAISEGGVANLLGRVQTRLESQVDAILVRLRQARLICSDETSARVKGQTQWEWVFQNQDCCLHVSRPSRGTQVIREVLQDHRPQVWVSDLFSAQKNHPAQTWQVCLAHQ